MLGLAWLLSRYQVNAHATVRGATNGTQPLRMQNIPPLRRNGSDLC